ncbi:hypothetical protein ABIB62_000827 [Mucilaginibacter sp. UYP25]|uniref:hypothetical protein n=1 Tax=unclassified Mucilaginibacter TaxID=2617802 RepID=UPI003398D1CB
MKYFIAILLINFFTASNTFAQQNVTAKEIRNFINKRVTITDTVYKTKIINSKLRVLSLGTSDSDSKVIVIQKENFDTFRKKSSLTGFKISAKGIVKLINGTPTIYTTNKIVVLGPIDL